MAIQLKTKPGINGANVLAIPKDWDPVWFRHFVNNQLKGADVRNAIAGTGITITGNISSPYATISATGGGAVTTISSSDGSVIITNPSGPTVNLSVPGQGLFNITPDLHPLIPTGVGLGPNDEFETGATIDLTGARYSGATAWSWVNQSTATAAISGDGSLIMSGTSAGANNIIVQPVPVTPYTYSCKVSINATSVGGGTGIALTVYNSTSTKLYVLLVDSQVNTQTRMELLAFNSPTSFNGTIAVNTLITSAPWQYLRVMNDGTNLIFSSSPTGNAGSYQLLVTVSLSTFISSVTHIGLSFNNNIAAAVAMIDWFRRTA